MSRELKFRAWDKKHRKYTKVLKIYFGSGGGNLGALVEDYETNYAFELQANQVELEQYTGLKDKNGKEIYEGDIMCWDNSKFSFQGHGVVMHEHGGWYVTETICTLWACITLYKAEVIGNIHEKPELLGGKE